MNRGHICRIAVLFSMVAAELPTCCALSSFQPVIPTTWDEAALAEWATPLAGLNVRPTHISSSQYYSAPEYGLRSYPVYMPGREPSGYWDMLQHARAKPLLERDRLRSEADWVEAGQRVFDEATSPYLTVFDPQIISQLRSRAYLEKVQAVPWSDGTLGTLRWVPTEKGMALSTLMCGGCHILFGEDGTRVCADFLEGQNHIVRGASPFYMGDGPLGNWLYQAYSVPWLKDDPNRQLKTITDAEFSALVKAERNGGAITRWNGSPLFPAKIPDLIGIKDRRYIDHTATHLHRGIGDLMRYAAQVTFAEMTDFGPYHVLAPETRRVRARLPDDALYALALYHAAAIHQQQTHAGAGFHSPRYQSGVTRRLVRLGRDRPGLGASDA